MNLFQPSKALHLSLLAMLCACSGGLDPDVGADPAQSATGDVSCTTPDASRDAGTGPATDSGRSTPLSARPNDLCGPAGEGNFPWAPCDAARGLVCVRSDPQELDAPPTCQCSTGKVFQEGACVPR